MACAWRRSRMSWETERSEAARRRERRATSFVGATSVAFRYQPMAPFAFFCASSVSPSQ